MSASYEYLVLNTVLHDRQVNVSVVPPSPPPHLQNQWEALGLKFGKAGSGVSKLEGRGVQLILPGCSYAII